MFRLDRVVTMTEGDRFGDERGKTLRDFYALSAHADRS
jgi:hypothetical protein